MAGERVEGEALATKVQKLKTLERYLKNARFDGFDRNIILALMATEISKRDDFARTDKLDVIQKRLQENGFLTERNLDREHNLYALSLRTETEQNKPVRIDYELCTQSDYYGAYAAYKEIEHFYEKGVSVFDGEQKAETLRAEEFFKYITEKGKEGMNIQRYKGLGEMNPEQLWETTMNPEKRSLVKVAIEDAVEADQVFTVLMGNNIETRRTFIEENALSVRNLDI